MIKKLRPIDLQYLQENTIQFRNINYRTEKMKMMKLGEADMSPV
jgi:hypothetical protein